MISEVLATVAYGNGQQVLTPQGEMAGHGLNLGNTPSFNRFFEEHGYIIGIMNVQPKTAYQQGLPRHFSKTISLITTFLNFSILESKKSRIRRL